jgi:hypothetical protein
MRWAARVRGHRSTAGDGAKRHRKFSVAADCRRFRQPGLLEMTNSAKRRISLIDAHLYANRDLAPAVRRGMILAGVDLAAAIVVRPRRGGRALAAMAGG